MYSVHKSPGVFGEKGRFISGKQGEMPNMSVC